MIATWPNKIKAGTISNHISSFCDVLPTLNNVANVETHFKGDGISFYNTLTGSNTQEDHEFLYWEFLEYGGQIAVRIGKWKILWQAIKKGNKNIELYDLDKDKEEHNNLAEQHPEIVTKLFEIEVI